MKHAKSDLLQGTLDLLILRTLASGDMHGWGIAQRLQQISRDVLQLNQPAMTPAVEMAAMSYGVPLDKEQPARAAVLVEQPQSSAVTWPALADLKFTSPDYFDALGM